MTRAAAIETLQKLRRFLVAKIVGHDDWHTFTMSTPYVSEVTDALAALAAPDAPTLVEHVPCELNILEWARERWANSVRIAQGKTGPDLESWLEDVNYWALIVVALTAQATGEPSGWQDISSAPKDGTPVLVFDEGAIMIASYINDMNASEAGWYDNGLMEPPPSHWLPLPAPPRSPEGEPDGD